MPTSGGTHGKTDQLSAFVRTYLAEHDESERALARRAVDPMTGLTLQHTWINSLAHGTMSRAPELWRLRALAAGMNVPVQMLAELAAAQWLGVEVAEFSVGGGKDWVAVSVPEGLSPEERARFIRMVEDIARHMTK